MSPYIYVSGPVFYNTTVNTTEINVTLLQWPWIQQIQSDHY